MKPDETKSHDDEKKGADASDQPKDAHTDPQVNPADREKFSKEMKDLGIEIETE